VEYMKCLNCGSEYTIIRDGNYNTNIKGRDISVVCKRMYCTECSQEVKNEELDREAQKKH
jgi:DNA-directed RNA polymerase subunit RPC12/RpoP